MISCGFTGHRPEKIIGKNTDGVKEQKIKDALKQNIYSLLNRGVRAFYTGMARGTDIWAAEIVLEFKKEYQDIKLTAVIPFPEQAEDWEEWDKRKYREILNGCSETVVIGQRDQKDVFKRRNQYLVDNSDYVIAVYDPRYIRSGTGQTVRMAEKAKREIIQINPREL